MSGAIVLYKRWRLRDGVTVEQVAALVTGDIVPHYRSLDAEVVLGLETWDDASVVAVQRWPSRARLDAMTTGPTYDAWWRAYEPVLARWDAMVELDSEWEAEVHVRSPLSVVERPTCATEVATSRQTPG